MFYLRNLLILIITPSLVYAQALNHTERDKHLEISHNRNRIIQPVLTSMVVAVILNEVKKGDLYIYVDEHGNHLANTLDLDKIGLRALIGKTRMLNEQTYLILESVQGLSTKLDHKTLTLLITAKPTLLSKNIIDMSSKKRKTSLVPTNNSAFVNYRIGYGAVESGPENFNFASEVGLRVSDYLLLSNYSYNKTQSGTNSVRLMSNLTYDQRVDLTRLTIGDFFAVSGDLGSSMNLGGISFSKRYAIDPYFINRPTLNLEGVVSTPSEADIYLNDVHLRNVKLSPGEFELQNINYYGGSRDVKVVIKDIYGREQVINKDYYFTAALLQQGLHEYSYNIGFNRQSYGLESNDYGSLATSIFHRYGFTDHLTLGIRAESLGSAANAGPFLSWRLAEYGVFLGGLALSRDTKSDHGIATQLGYQYQQGNFSGKLLWRRFNEDYVIASGLESPNKPKMDTSVGINYGTRYLGYFGVNHSINTQHNGSELRTTNFTYNKTLFNQISFSAALGHIDSSSLLNKTSENNLFVGLTYYLDNNYAVRVSHRESTDSNSDSIQLSKNIPIGEGWGFRVKDDNVSTAGYHDNTLDSYLQINTRRAIFNGEYQAMNGKDRYQLSAAGAVGYVAGEVDFSRPIYDSFALVQVADLSGVEVLRNNQPIGKTNAAGQLFIPNLGSYFDNQISVNDRDIPINYNLKARDLYLSPSWRSGSFVRFDISPIRAAIGKILMKSGSVVEPLRFSKMEITRLGATAEKSTTFLTGKAGEYYIEDIKPGRYVGRAEIKTGHCTFELNVSDGDEIFMQLGETFCEKIH